MCPLMFMMAASASRGLWKLTKPKLRLMPVWGLGCRSLGFGVEELGFREVDKAEAPARACLGFRV